MIPEQLALLLIKQKNHNKRFGGFDFEYFGDSDVVNKLNFFVKKRITKYLDGSDPMNELLMMHYLFIIVAHRNIKKNTIAFSLQY